MFFFLSFNPGRNQTHEKESRDIKFTAVDRKWFSFLLDFVHLFIKYSLFPTVLVIQQTGLTGFFVVLNQS